MNNLLARVQTASVLLAAVSLGACGTARNGTSVQTSMFISGSSQPTTVAKNTLQKSWEFLVNSSLALAPPSLVDSNGAQVTLSQAWIVVKSIEFKADEVEGDAEKAIDETSKTSGKEVETDEIKFKGPYYVDLLSANPSPIDTQTVPAQAYRRIKLKLHKSNSAPTDAPAELDGNSVFFAGAIGSATFTFASDEETVFQIAGPNGVTPDSVSDLLVVMRTADLFKKIDLSSLSGAVEISSSHKVSASNPCPLIDASASDLYTCFRKGIESSANFGKDHHKDHDLHDDDDKVK